MSWVYLVIAGFFEVGFTTFLKLTEGFTKAAPTFFFLAFSILSFWFLNRAIVSIPLGVAYAVWTGIGAAGTVFMGILLFEDQVSFWKIFFLINLIGSILGLKLVT
jgi:quaternary ammonium compound-resistance protein SugE